MEQKQTGFFFDEWCFWHTTGLHATVLPVGGWVQAPSSAAHAESPESKRRFKNLMDVSGLTRQLDARSASPVTEEDLLRVHPQHYLSKFKNLSDQGGGLLDEHAPIGPGSYEIAKVSAGLACEAVEKVLLGELQNAYSLSRPPGHHCLPDKPMGFCFLANIPIAIERAKAKFGLNKVAVIDWDVHHGNGTQHIYYERDDVLTISLHQEHCFPPGYHGTDDLGEGKGLGYNINIPLLPGCGDEAYLYAFESIVLPALEKFQPDMIIVACGYDANAFDPLARLLLTSETFRRLAELTKQAAEKLCQGKLVMVHEGGYAESYVPFCGLAVVEALSGIRTSVQDPCIDLLKLQQPSAPFNQFQKQLTDQLAQKINSTP
ncbi:class II histone deacetylase [Acinetobacter sp. VNK23]|uniref:class II histone deacetylase n=1 Tax=Acinetobacter thutiue TaxID=2998078 RepID=UPI0025753B9B|nr:class II histone deacetylase [Acinetobacter thutiue]MDM1019380.1 class II histone deacetylase [Acinetobacter thutiue]